MAKYILYWWKKDNSNEDMKTCTTINAQIRTAFRDMETEKAQRFQIPPTEIQLWQQRLKDSLWECRMQATDENLSKLARCAITLTNNLRIHGLDLKMVVEQSRYRQIFDCLQKSTDHDVKDLTQKITDTYLETRPQQKQHIESGTSIVIPFMHNNGKVTMKNLALCQQQLEMLNETLKEKNLSLGIPPRIITSQQKTSTTRRYRSSSTRLNCLVS
ncbi:hypothetical protein GQ44DRAFT_784350 [Phaeosphaeriaceae sp. PMI808]|nr:hypothetical protein GQ44DRAFT_784350 [Phaeosphaeriaceae sp. PMI808]